MKKLLLTTAIVMSFGTTAAFAHHPAEEMVDPVTYEMIDTNLIDTPHYDMTFDDMGADDNIGGDLDVGGDSDVGGAATARDMEDGGAEIGENAADVGAEMEERVEMNATAATEPSGPGAQR